MQVIILVCSARQLCGPLRVKNDIEALLVMSTGTYI
jgi:hypothetical protein